MGTSAGSIYDGNGRLLEGDGPPNALGLMEAITHKTVLHNGSAATQTLTMWESDRLWLLPADLSEPAHVPQLWMVELATLLTKGGKVGIMARNAESLATVVSLLSTADAFLSKVRAEADVISLQASGKGAQSVGILCDGTGGFLDGDTGQAVAWQIDERLQFRAFLNGGQGAASRPGLLASDRFYMMPADYEVRRALPLWMIAQLMRTLKLGGKVLVVAPSREAFTRFVKIVGEPEKLFLLIEPTVGNA